MKKRYAIVEEMIDDDGRIISQKHTGREVIECKDCMHYDDCHGDYKREDYDGWYVAYTTIFCSMWERKDNG